MKNGICGAYGGKKSGAVGVAASGESIEERAAKFARFELFSTPGHKGGLNPMDLTEYDEDELFPADSVRVAEKRAAEHYGVMEARFLTGGASMGVKAAILAAGTDIVAPAFTHNSAFQGARLAGKRIFTFGEIDEVKLPKVPTPSDFSEAFGAHPTAGAALVTSPDYFGRCADVEGIAEVCKSRGKLLIADCAHGAHFASRPDLFPSGGEKIADFSVVSVHKTLRALTQSAVGAVNNERYIASYDDALELLGTTSPSYLLLASIENAINYERQNARSYGALVAECKSLRDAVPCFAADDPMRIAVDAAAMGVSGRELYYALIGRGIMPETYYGDACVFIVTLSDSAEKVARLKTALTKIQEEVANGR